MSIDKVAKGEAKNKYLIVVDHYLSSYSTFSDFLDAIENLNSTVETNEILPPTTAMVRGGISAIILKSFIKNNLENSKDNYGRATIVSFGQNKIWSIDLSKNKNWQSLGYL